MPPPSHSDCDVLVIGAGPAGLACAIRLLRRAPSLRVWVLEKASAPGAHLLSGAVIDPAPLRELLSPDDFAALPLGPAVGRQRFAFLTRHRAFPLPWVPPVMSMRGQPFADAAALGRALARIAERLGAEILCSQPAVALDFASLSAPPVVHTGDPRTPESVAAARAVVLAEGPAGTLARSLADRFSARHPQSWALGVKRVYATPTAPSRAVGAVLHTFGHPLPSRVYGGGFVYRPSPARLDIGFVTALDAPIPPAPSPRHAFLDYLAHPAIAPLLSGAAPVSYGARLLPEGGWDAIPPALSLGTALYLVGDDAGLLDAFSLKGLHLAVESGIAAADAILDARPLSRNDLPSASLLRRHRAYRAPFSRGLLPGMASAALLWLTRGLLPPSLPPPPAGDSGVRPAFLPLSDPALSADLALARLAPLPPSLPPHVALRDPFLCANCSAPCLGFCPAAVYEAPAGDPSGAPLLHPENCLHCRTCLVRCPRANIGWTPPPAGPSYLL